MAFNFGVLTRSVSHHHDISVTSVIIVVPEDIYMDSVSDFDKFRLDELAALANPGAPIYLILRFEITP